MTTPRLKALALNSTIVLVASVIGYLLIEVIFFRIILPFSPPGLQTYLPETADVLAQNSKSSLVPHNYVAIFGDSYARGVGDWLLEAGNNRALPFHSVHVIHDRLQRDIVSFGRSDIGSAEALVRMPTHILKGSDCFLFPHIGDPSGIVVYFYEGNDIRDNLFFLTRVNAAYGGTDAARIDRYLSEVYATFASWRCHLHLTDIVGRAVKFQYYVLKYGELFTQTNAVKVNSLLVADKTASAPNLQGPDVKLSDEQIIAGISVFDRSLAWLRRRFAGVPVTVVYVPAPLSIYRLVGEKAFFYGRKLEFDPSPFGEIAVATIERNSALLCGLVRQASIDHGAGFVDARPALRAAAQTQIIHGPRDWLHFNRIGYTVLGNLVADHLGLPGAPSGGACAAAAPKTSAAQ